MKDEGGDHLAAVAPQEWDAGVQGAVRRGIEETDRGGQSEILVGLSEKFREFRHLLRVSFDAPDQRCFLKRRKPFRVFRKSEQAPEYDFLGAEQVIPQEFSVLRDFRQSAVLSRGFFPRKDLVGGQYGGLELVGRLEKEGEVKRGPRPWMIPEGIRVDFNQGDWSLGCRADREFVQPP